MLILETARVFHDPFLVKISGVDTNYICENRLTSISSAKSLLLGKVFLNTLNLPQLQKVMHCLYWVNCRTTLVFLDLR